MRLAWTGAIALALLMAATALIPGTAAAAPSCDEGPETDGKTIYGTPCDDKIVVPPGVNRVYGEGGEDSVYAGRGNARLFGGPGADRLYGGPGDDRLRGGPGDDLLSGGFGADSLDGEDGSDLLRGDATIDYLFDSGGVFDRDTLSFATGVTPGFNDNEALLAGEDRGVAAEYEGFPEDALRRGVFLNLGRGFFQDRAQGYGFDGFARDGGGVDEVTGADFEVIVGSPFADVIRGTPGEETIYGGGGGDVILGEGGADTIYGGYPGAAESEEPGEGEPGEGEGEEPGEGEAPPVRDYCEAPEGTTTFDCESGEKVVAQRDPATVEFGRAGPGTGDSGDGVYLSGSDGDDRVVAGWNGTSREVIFTVDGALLGSIALDHAPDSVLLAGLEGGDDLTVDGFPRSTSVVLLGGPGDDELRGGEGEDVLVDGTGSDTLRGEGGDDSLTNGAGTDDVGGGGGNDLVISSVSVCEGDDLDGGDDRDNAQWAQFGEGVSVDLGEGEAGLVGDSGGPACDGEPRTSLGGFEDVEGSNNDDYLVGDSGNNVILGRTGADSFLAMDGNDVLLANSADADRLIDCGEGTDRAIVDRPEFGDPDPTGCEAVFENDPNSFQPPETPPNPPEPEPEPEPPPPPPDTDPPVTEVLQGPADPTLSRRAVRRVAFVLGADEPARYVCRIDKRAPRRCGAVARFFVARGEHILRAWAIDAAGNRDMSPATHEFETLRVIVRSSRIHRRPARTR